MEVQVVCVVTIIGGISKLTITDSNTAHYFEHQIISSAFIWVSVISFTHLANNKDTPGTVMSVSLHALS